MSKITFAYNANSGRLNAIFDTFHKTLSPSTYKCHLCQITYGATNMKKEWRSFLDSLPYEKEFLHKDEYMKEGELPMVLLDQKVLVSAEELAQIENLNGLITTLNERLVKFDNE